MKILIAAMFALMTTVAGASPLLLQPDTTIALRGEVTDANTSKLITQILTSKAETLNFYIDSPGGSVIAGTALIDVMRTSGKHFVCVINTAISMAFSIAQACDERLVLPHAIMMQHMGSYTVEGQVPNNESMVAMLSSIFKKLNQEDASRLRMEVPDFYAKIRNDWWMYGDEAVFNRAADGDTTVACSPALIAGRVTEIFQVFIFQVKLTLSTCPLMTAAIETKGGDGRKLSDTELSIIEQGMSERSTRRLMQKWYRTP